MREVQPSCVSLTVVFKITSVLSGFRKRASFSRSHNDH